MVIALGVLVPQHGHRPGLFHFYAGLMPVLRVGAVGKMQVRSAGNRLAQQHIGAAVGIIQQPHQLAHPKMRVVLRALPQIKRRFNQLVQVLVKIDLLHNDKPSRSIRLAIAWAGKRTNSRPYSAAWQFARSRLMAVNGHGGHSSSPVQVNR